MIIDRLAPGLPDDTANAVAAVTHAAYGAVTGAVFAQLVWRRSHAPVLGLAYGLLVWAIGHEGWVPAVGVLPPAHRDRPGRVGTMVTAHLLFGYVLGRQLRHP
ncbi:hypothetical protein [uncultured Amnibacterium sp.]|uniref:hypothetical protein n=1 Tax=uncultured Amnibacterium sp. TaxID=1631851 RepID=UPI0035CB01F7